MRQEHRRSSLVFVVLLAAAAVSITPGRPAAAEPSVTVFPGMEIHQGAVVCTLGFVQVSLRIAVTTGPCDGGLVATDSRGRTIGNVARERRVGDAPAAGGAPPDVEYEVIGLSEDVHATDVLPDGRQLLSKPGAGAAVSDTLCHFGIASGESCGRVSAVNGNHFTIDGTAADDRDVGGPVYAPTDNNGVVIAGLLETVTDSSATAEFWQAAMQQLFMDTLSSGQPPVRLAAAERTSPQATQLWRPRQAATKVARVSRAQAGAAARRPAPAGGTGGRTG